MTNRRVAAFDRKRLRMAREARGWTRRQLADTVGVTPAAISQYENGAYQPSRPVLAAMAIALGMPREFFLPGRPTITANSSVVHFRSLRSTSVRDRRRAFTHAAFAWELTNLLENYLTIPPVALPHAVLPEQASKDDIENLATECRRLLNLGSDPIPNMTRLLETLGAVVVRLPVECEKVDAFSCVLEDRPVVVLNSDRNDTARARNAAAHEFGHLVAHDDADPGSQIIEQQARTFAAAFLMPADQVAADLSPPLNWNRLIALKQHWGVSVASLIVRAKTLGTISEHTYRRAFIKLTTTKNDDGTTWRQKEPGYLGPPEQPVLLHKCVELVADLGISRDDLANKLRLPRHLIDDLVGQKAKPTVRLEPEPLPPETVPSRVHLSVDGDIGADEEMNYRSASRTIRTGGGIVAKQHRSAVTGRFVKHSTAKRNPRTTVSETVKSPKKSK